MDQVVSRALKGFHSSGVTAIGPGLLIFLGGCCLYHVLTQRKLGEPIRLGDLLGFILPVQAARSPSLRIDLFFYVLSKLTHHVLLIGHIALAVLISHGLGKALAGRFDNPMLAPTPAIVVLAGILVFVPRDLAHYWTHRLHHKIPLLWEFHKVHHAATHLTPLTTERTHPLEDQVFSLVEGLAMGVALGVLRWRYAFTDLQIGGVAATTIWAMRMLTLTPLQHSPAPLHFGLLDRLFYSPSLHQVHHSAKPEHWDRNFGECLSIWDSLFGSYCAYGHNAPQLGLPQDEHRRYESLLGCYFRPFGQAWKQIAGWSQAGLVRKHAATSHPQV